ncbi:MAG: hypothetical protein IPM06_19870 [Rhizobiales bacterium]|nr:hypothetical protein [Hyphomicrobiales bacterium]
MAYKLYQFAGVTLPTGAPEDDQSTGETPTSLVNSVGGVFNAWGADVRLARKQTFTQKGIYSGVTTYLVDHSGNHILDHSGNRILVGSAGTMMRGKVDALKRLQGRQGSVTRYRLSDAAIHFKTARLLKVQHDATFSDYNMATLRSTFETTMVNWRATAQRSATMAYTGVAFANTNNRGEFTVDDAILTITASSTITTLTITTDNGTDLRWTGTLASGQALVINAGTQTVTKAGVNAYSGFSFGAGHTVATWLPLAVGDNLLSIAGNGAGTAVLTWYDQFA